MSPRLLTMLLVPLGVVLGHVVAYLAPHTEPVGQQPGHHHLAGLALVGLVGAMVAIALSALGAARGRASHVGWSRLAGAQCVVYVALELAESAVSGATFADAFAAPTLRIGVVVQLAVAAVLVLVLRMSVAVGRQFGSLGRRARRRAAPAVRAPMDMPARRASFTPASRRGPPVVAARAS